MKSIKRKIENLTNKKSTIVVCDFDYTMTTKDSNSSIAVFSNYLPERYRKRKKKIDCLVKIMKNETAYRFLWKLKLKLLKKYDGKNILDKIDYRKEFSMNNKMIDIIKLFNKKGVPIIIYSSGIQEIIVNIFNTYSINFDSIKIIANNLDNMVDVITPYKKEIPILNNKKVILIGDNEKDLNFVNTDYLIQILNDIPTIIKWG